MILCNNEEIYKKINSAVFPGTGAAPLEHIIAAKAVCLRGFHGDAVDGKRGAILEPGFHPVGVVPY